MFSPNMRAFAFLVIGSLWVPESSRAHDSYVSCGFHAIKLLSAG